MKCLVSLFIGLLTLASIAQAQVTPFVTNDSTLSDVPLISNSQKTLDEAELIEMYSKRFIPRKAGLYSAIVPGLGQAYNKKYWKMPIIYGGFIGFGFGIDFYQKRHKKFRSELFDILESGEFESASGFDESQLRTIVDKARRERDFYLVLTGLWYLLNVADAHIDAHLKEFDLNEKLKLSLDPMIRHRNELQAGLSISLNFH